MSAAISWFGLGYVGLGALLVALGVPLVRRKVPPNGLYGIRIEAAAASEEAWYRINHHGGRPLVYMGIATATAGVANALLLPVPAPPWLCVLEALLPGILLVPTLVHVYRYPAAPGARERGGA